MKKFTILLVALVVISSAMAQWMPQNSGTTNNLYSVYFIDENTGFSVGDNGTIIKTDDGGTSWSMQNSETLNTLSSVFFRNADTGFVVGTEGTILKTIDGGLNWIQKPSGTLKPLGSVCFPENNIGYIVGGEGYDTAIILKTTDYGESWTSQLKEEQSFLSSVQFINADTGYACGGMLGGCLQQNGIILKTTNGGSAWNLSLMFGVEYGILYSISAVNNEVVYSVGAAEEGPPNTDMTKTTDGGINWFNLPSVSSSQLRNLHFLNPNTGYLIGCNSESGDGCILKTSDGGTTWNSYNTGIQVWLNSVYFPTNDIGYTVGTNGIILKTTSGGITGEFERTKGLESLKIIPNPSNDKITISLPSLNRNTLLSIFTVSGEKVLEKQLTNTETQIDISALPHGVYFVRLQNEKMVEVVKMIKG